MSDNRIHSTHDVKAQVVMNEKILAEWSLPGNGDLPSLTNNLSELQKTINVFLTDLIESKSGINESAKQNTATNKNNGDDNDDNEDEEEEDDVEGNILSDLIKEVTNKCGKVSKESNKSEVNVNNRTRSAKRLKK
ncbi:hypothetical protein RUM43_006830 [Polyplax serrata]|uniref:Uncharacterized protein n=1 Tax=Polyplax serrata TaxID=468196 RepID=A0AAN8Q5D5_POLSC